MTTRNAAQSLDYDAEEVAQLFDMVENPKKREDEIGLEQAPPIGEEGEYGEAQEVFTQDAYSLLYTARFCSRTFFFALFILVLQGGMLLVTFFDLADFFSDEPDKNNGVSNRLRIPQGATLTVTLSQFLGMTLMVIMMAADGDAMIGFIQLVEGYDPDIQAEMPHATCFRWFVTGVLQIFVGVVLIADSFILSMQSSTVIDLVLNLTALFFVQEIDELAFTVADMGLFSNEVQADCERVKNVKCIAPRLFERRVLIWKRVLIVVMTVAIFIPYSIVINWQYTGRYMCDTLYIELDDTFDPSFAYYSGRFDVQGYGLSDLYNSRARYIDETKTLQLAYCGSEKAWTISMYGPEPVTDNPCAWRYKSSETETFDVTEVANTKWFYNADDLGDVAVDWLQVVCIECQQVCTNSDHGNCVSNPTKDAYNNQYCSCNNNRTGHKCELTRECSFFAIDERTLESLATIPGASFFIEAEFASLFALEDWGYESTHMTMHGRDIFVPASQNVDAFMLFSGRRWIIYSTKQEDDVELSIDDFIGIFNKTHPSVNPVEALDTIRDELPEFSPIFFSSPVNYGSPTYSALPSAVAWVIATALSNNSIADSIVPAKPDDEQPVSAKLLCSDCFSTLVTCQNGGYCNTDGYCICSEYYSGYQCERARDCIEYGCYNNLGECNRVTRVCEKCANESYGNLCQYGPEQLEDPYFCSKCYHCTGCHNGGYDFAESCNAATRECVCSEGWEGEFCDEKIGGDSGDTGSGSSVSNMPNTNTSTGAANASTSDTASGIANSSSVRI